MCIWWSRMFLDSRCTYSCIYCWLHHDSMWLCTPSTIFWRGYFTCYCYGELHVISGITSDPETTLLLLLENILYGLLFAHPPPPPPPLPHFTKNKVHCHFEIPLHTLFEHCGGSVSDYCLLVICVNCFASTLHSFELLWGWTCSTIKSGHEQAP